jgi:3-methyladenine DNA glycosylase/8-oxoguanine DNA glycosylase
MIDHASLPDSSRKLRVVPPFDLARTVAPVWWARGRWPNVDWRDGTLTWVGWEDGGVVWRSARQQGEAALGVAGSGNSEMDGLWAERVLGVDAAMPEFGATALRELAVAHRGMKPWAAGSLYEGVVSSLVGQSISVAAAAVTEQRLCALFNAEVVVDGRSFWPVPSPEQLGAADVGLVRTSGVTTKRAQALVEVGRQFADGMLRHESDRGFERRAAEAQLMSISGIGPWTVRSAFLWGLGDPDAHPSGDVALLRAVRRWHPDVLTLKDLDRVAADWAPHRGWAARLYWLDLLGFDGARPPSP